MSRFTTQKSGRRTVRQFRRIEHARRPQRRRITAPPITSPTKTPPSLLSLPDDVLSLVVHHVMAPLKLSGQQRVVEHSYKAALPLAQSCRRFGRLFDAQLRSLELWQSRNISACCVVRLAERVGENLRRLVLRGCAKALDDGRALNALALHCPNIHTLDVSHTNVKADDMVQLLQRLPFLRELRIRGCANLGNQVLQAVGRHCPNLVQLDASECVNISKSGIHSLLAHRVASSLRVLALSRCPRIGDDSLEVIATCATELRSLTLRGLPLVTNEAVAAVCRALGLQLGTLDVLDCERVHVDCFVECVRRYCPNIAWRVPRQPGRTLKQVVISSLAGNIFYVTGSDICNGKAAVYFLLVDSGTYDSFRVSIGSSSLDLTNFGAILASCFGSQPNQYVKDVMFSQYGLDLASDADEDSVVSIQ